MYAYLDRRVGDLAQPHILIASATRGRSTVARVVARGVSVGGAAMTGDAA